MKPIHETDNDAERRLTTRKEAVRKDVGRCFGVLKSLLRILKIEGFYWRVQDVVEISECCVILQNLLLWIFQNDLFDFEDGENGGDLLRKFDAAVGTDGTYT